MIALLKHYDRFAKQRSYFGAVDPVDDLAVWIMQQGYSIDWHARLDANTQAQVNHSQSKVWVRHKLDYLDRLLALAHEAGHILHRLRLQRSGRSTLDCTMRECERGAYLYGWQLLRRFDTTGLISRQHWKSEHAYARGKPCPLYEQLAPSYNMR